jgi:hypothetical protein
MRHARVDVAGLAEERQHLVTHDSVVEVESRIRSTLLEHEGASLQPSPALSYAHTRVIA